VLDQRGRKICGKAK